VKCFWSEQKFTFAAPIQKSHSQSQTQLLTSAKPPRLSFSYFHWFLVFFMHIFNLLESNVMVYQAHILSKTINICQSQRYKFGYLFFFQTYGFLLWDSDGYIYLRGNKRRIISWRFISGMTTVKCKCTRRRIDFQNYFIKNQIWCFTIVEVTKNSEILSPIFIWICS